jgi:hypothetical protein
MKTSNLKRIGRPGILWFAFAALTVIFTSCSKIGNDDVLVGEAKVIIVNAAAGSAAQDFYLENVKINTTAVAYSQPTPYMSAQAGYSRKAEFRDSGSATVNFTGYLDILPNRTYTFFFITKADGTGTSSAAFSDETNNPSATKARVRFVNLASGLTAANLLIVGGATIASNVAFGSASDYSDVDPGTLNLQTSLAGEGAASSDLGGFTLQRGKTYTIYTSGSLATAVTASLITHN